VRRHRERSSPGSAGPLLVHGEHAQGEFYVPLATAEGTEAACRWIVQQYPGIEHFFLEILGCYGAGKVRKLAEIVAATVLCGELSLGSAIVADEWVGAHDLHGRNRT
jgi:hydroxymethylglutaryl-CoA reductase